MGTTKKPIASIVCIVLGIALILSGIIVLIVNAAGGKKSNAATPLMAGTWSHVTTDSGEIEKFSYTPVVSGTYYVVAENASLSSVRTDGYTVTFTVESSGMYKLYSCYLTRGELYEFSAKASKTSVSLLISASLSDVEELVYGSTNTGSGSTNTGSGSKITFKAENEAKTTATSYGQTKTFELDNLSATRGANYYIVVKNGTLSSVKTAGETCSITHNSTTGDYIIYQCYLSYGSYDLSVKSEGSGTVAVFVTKNYSAVQDYIY